MPSFKKYARLALNSLGILFSRGNGNVIIIDLAAIAMLHIMLIKKIINLVMRFILDIEEIKIV